MNAFPFDSRIITYDADGLPVYDRASNAAEFASLLHSFFINGIFGAEMCEVLHAGGMDVTVGVGKMLIEGRFGNIQTPETVTIPASEGLNRIDTVVLRLDLGSAVNYIVTDVVKGVAASNPVAPTLTRDGTVWELGLADILVPSNSTAVNQMNITDTRLNDERCGLVAAVLTDIDTTHLYDQIQAELAYFKDVEEAEFNEWFATIQGLLEGDVAANLAAEILKKAETFEATAVLLASGWSGEGPCTQTVTAEGVLSADSPFVELNLATITDAEEMANLNDAWSSVLKGDSGTDSVTLTFADLPEVDIPIKIKVVR